MTSELEINFGFGGLIGFWLLSMLTAEVWYGTTSVLTSISTWVTWSFWGHMILTIIVPIVLILVLLIVYANIIEPALESLLRKGGYQ